MNHIKEYDLTAFTDHTGELGWCIGTLDAVFPELDACVTGRLLAHDLLEHNPDSTLKGLTNELEALGAAHYVSGEKYELDQDLIGMAYYATVKSIAVPRETLEIDYSFTCFVHSAAKLILEESQAETSEQRKNLSAYLRHIAGHMQNGYNWAQQRYTDTNVNYLSSDIEEKFLLPEFDGQMGKIIINEKTMDIEYKMCIDAHMELDPEYEDFDDFDE